MMQIKTIYEDNKILVLDKPAGVIVNRADTHESETMQDYIETNYDFDVTDSAEEYKSRSGIVHRLDKDTSGILLIAKDPDTFLKLQAQFKDRSIQKEYKAVVLGKFTEPSCEINAPIGRNPNNRLVMGVVDGAKEAVTLVKLIKNTTLDATDFSFLSVTPKTGRTHQIRVHLAALKFPVAGDPIYCSRKQFEISQKYFSRMMLHAESLTIIHPETGKVMSFESQLPEDFSPFI